MENEKYMHRALELAKLGSGYVSPNPMVGCVIVKGNEIIGEGYHANYGGPHAEVNAVKNAREENVRSSIVYVTLEPCSHQGKTPPCADMLVRLKPQKVVISNLDPNPLVAGKGIQKLLDAGIEVEKGILEQEGKELNKRFFTFMTKKRPFIILKWAQTADGFIARENYDSKWISSEESRKLVHQWRAEEAAIMVGTNTAIHDNPSLNIRFGIEGSNPIRVVIDKDLKIPNTHSLFDQSQKTICYNLIKTESDGLLEYVQVQEKNILEHIFDDLFQRKILSIIIEGGTYLLNKLLSQDLWDEARVFRSEQNFVKGIKAPIIDSSYLLTKNRIGKDSLVTYYK